MSLNDDGTAEPVTGNPDIGGSGASPAMMAAEVLGSELANVRPTIGDTATIGYGFLTGGSRVTFATGTAVVAAAHEVVRQLRERAAKIWRCTLADVISQDGVAVVRDGLNATRRELSLAAIAATAGNTGGPITGRAALNVGGVGAGFGTHICDVEIDPETGRVSVIRCTAIQDVGRAIRPGYAEG